MDKIILANSITDKSVQVFACHPLDFEMIRRNAKDLPFGVLVYPNEYCNKGEMVQANPADPGLMNFLYDHILEQKLFVLGENREYKF